MMTATNTRKKAREALTGKWGKGALIALAYILLSVVINFIEKKFENSGALELIVSILVIIIEIPISYGFIVSFIKLKRGEEIGAFDFFKAGFDNFGRAWGILGNTLVKMILPIALVVISVIIIASTIGISAIGALAGNSTGSLSSLAILGIVLYFVAIIYAFVESLLYSLSNYIAYDNAEMTTKEAVEESARLMKGKRGNLFCLELSFIGWAILSAIALCIGFFWLVPYMQVALVCFYEEVAQKENKIESDIQSDN